MTMQIILINGERHVINQCGTCAVWHTIPEIIYRSYEREGGYWHCPNGHQRGFREGSEKLEEERIRRERDVLKQNEARLLDEIAAERKRTEEANKRTEEAQKRTAQVQRRAVAGVCPCCNRTFVNMQRHMKTKHPNVVPLDQKQPA